MPENPWSSTDVVPLGGGRYSAAIAESWMLLLVPQGGVLAAVAARAMAAELHLDEGPTQQLRTIHGVFASPVPQGPLEVEVTVLRRGRSASQAQATVRAPGAAAGFTALAVFGGERPGFTFTELTPPEVPEPDDCPSFRDPPPPEANWEARPSFPFWLDVLEGRPALGHPPWDESPREAAEIATWYRWEQDPLGVDGGIDPLSSLVVADMMPGSVFERIGPVEGRWFAPSVDLTVHLFARPSPGWILGHNTARHAGDGYASVAQALWDPRGADGPVLVAYATQQCLFTSMD